MRVTCNHIGQGGAADLEPSELIAIAVRPGREPTGFLLRGRMIAGDKRLDGDTGHNKWNAMWTYAWENQELPHETHELACPTDGCGVVLRVRDLELRRLLTKLAEAGVDSVSWQSLPL